MFNFFKKKKDTPKEEVKTEALKSEPLEKSTPQIEAEVEPSPEVEIEIVPEIEEKIIQDSKAIENTEEADSPVKEEKGFLAKALAKTLGNFASIIPKRKEKIDFDEIEEILIESDMEYEIVEKAMDGLPASITRAQLRHRLVMLFEHSPKIDMNNLPKPFVQLIIGVNGAGKTTTIAKLAAKYKSENKSVVLGAGDTFRAAAIEQLSIWAKKIDVPIIKTQQGHDPSAVAFDTISSAVAKNVDHCIIDTAGRLQTQVNLNKELQKIVKVCNKAKEGTPNQKILIIDGTQGNTAIAQARAFNEMVDIDGIIVTKLDGTSKGGALFSISNQLELPIFYVGIGEKQEDLITFNPDEFVDGLLDGIYI